MHNIIKVKILLVILEMYKIFPYIVVIYFVCNLAILQNLQVFLEFRFKI